MASSILLHDGVEPSSSLQPVSHPPASLACKIHYYTILLASKLLTSVRLYIYCSFIVAEMLPNSLSWDLIFKIFLGGMPPDPPRMSMLCMLRVLCTPVCDVHR